MTNVPHIRTGCPLLLFVMAIAMTSLLIPLPHRTGMARISAVLDAGHFVLFSGLTWCLWRCLPGRVWLAAALATGLAALVEVVQPLTGRSGNPYDFLRGLLGCLATAAAVSAAQRPRTIPRAACWSLLAVAAAAWPLVTSLPAIADLWAAYHQRL